MNASETVPRSFNYLINAAQCRIQAALAVLNRESESLPEEAFAAIYVLEGVLPMLEELEQIDMDRGRAEREAEHV